MTATTKTDYTGVTCIPPHNETIRYVLKKEGNNPLFVIGLHSSTADEIKPDQTVSKAMKIAAANGFNDGFVMLNLYPQRLLPSKELPTTADENLLERNVTEIEKILGNVSNPTLWACWGSGFEDKGYFKQSLLSLLPVIKGAAVRAVGTTQAGHPLQPLSLNPPVADDALLLDFDINAYVKTLK